MLMLNKSTLEDSMNKMPVISEVMARNMKYREEKELINKELGIRT